MRSTIPSLNALRTFEAVARHVSFTRAAAELNVTQSAVSRMIRSLEDHLDLPLVERSGRKIALTSEGFYFAGKIGKALDILEMSSRELMDTRAGRGTLTIGMHPTFGTKWLLPRLVSFQQLHPELTVNVRASDGDLDFAHERIDVAVRFGYGNWPDARSEPLMSEELQVVCSPRIMDGPYPLVDYADLRRHPLIVHTTRPGAWAHWLQAVGRADDDLTQGLQLEHFYMVLQAAKAGLGIALLPSFLVADDIAAGNLVAPFPARVGSPGGYYIVTPWEMADMPRVKAFNSWVLDQV